MDWRLIGNVAGVLPVEAVLYDAAFHGMSILSGKTHKALMRVSKRELKGLWDDLGIRIGPSELVRAGGILPSSSMEMALNA